MVAAEEEVPKCAGNITLYGTSPITAPRRAKDVPPNGTAEAAATEEVPLL